MRYLFVLFFSLVSFTLLSQTEEKKDTIIYLSPEREVLDTLHVLAVLADVKQPLTVQMYTLITKSYVYKDGKVVPSEQWLEKVVGNTIIRVPNWKKKVIWILREEEY